MPSVNSPFKRNGFRFLVGKEEGPASTIPIKIYIFKK
jgi:hypothetical protein